MLKDFDTVMLDLKGAPAFNEYDKEGKGIGEPIKIGDPVLIALTVTDPEALAADKLARYRLAVKLSPGGEISITDEESVLIKTVVGKFAPPMVVGRVTDFLDAEAPAAAPTQGEE